MGTPGPQRCHRQDATPNLLSLRTEEKPGVRVAFGPVLRLSYRTCCAKAIRSFPSRRPGRDRDGQSAQHSHACPQASTHQLETQRPP